MSSLSKTGFGLLCAALLAGCNAGMAPEPMSREQARDALSKLTPEQQIAYVRSSPMPADQKAKRIAEIEAKYGVKADAAGGPPKTGP